MAIESILIELIADTTSLDSAIATLQKIGVVDTNVATQFKQASVEINKQASAIKSVAATSATTTKGLEDIARASKKVSASFTQGFQEGVIETLKEAGVSAKQFADALAKSGGTAQGSFKTVKAELRELTEQIARAKAAGQDYGDQYVALVQKAGRLRDAIGDVNREVRNVASDTSNIDGLIGIATGVTSAFTLAQSATILFGDESEDLQKTLVKVQATLAALQSVQMLANSLQKESAALKFLDKAATNAQIVAQKTYAMVVGNSTGTLKAFRVALAATGIGLIIIALAALIANWDKVKEAISGVSEEQKKLAEATKKSVEAEEEKLEALNDQDNVLKLQGKTEKEILQLKIKQTDEVIELRGQQLKLQGEILEAQISAEKRNRQILAGIINFITLPLNGIIKVVEKVAELFGKKLDLPSTGEMAKLLFDENEVEKEGKASLDALQKQIAALKNERAGLNLSIREIEKAAAEQRLKDLVASIESELFHVAAGSRKELELRKKLLTAKASLDLSGAKSAAEQKLIADKLHDDLLQEDASFAKSQIEIKIAAIQRQLAAAEEGSHEELRLRQRLIAEQANAELTNIKLSEEQKLLIKDKALRDQLKLTKEFNKQLTIEAINDQISRNNAELSQLKTNAEDRLLLQIANIELSAAAEIESAKENSAKIKEIIAKRDAEILDLRLKYIDEVNKKALEAERERQEGTRKILEAIVANEHLSAKKRIEALEEIKDADLKLVDLEIANLKAKYAKTIGLEKQFQAEYAALLKKRQGIEQASSDKSTDIFDLEMQNRLRVASEALSAIADTFSVLNDLANQQDQARIESMQRTLDEAKEAGAITEKEAISRQKRIDAEERKVRTESAKREKALAIFSAVINTAKAIVSALTVAPPYGIILAAIVGALGAVQIAAISARPIPKFRKGKKDRYEGYGEIGEAGAEILERNGRMIMVKEPTITWLGAKDKVYTPMETKAILDKPRQVVNKAAMNASFNHKMDMDYDRMGKEMRKALSKLPLTNVSFDENGFQRWSQEGQSKTNYFDKRYSFK